MECKLHTPFILPQVMLNQIESNQIIYDAANKAFGYISERILSSVAWISLMSEGAPDKQRV